MASGHSLIAPVRLSEAAACVPTATPLWFSVRREMGARPSHRPGRDRRRYPAEPGDPAGTFLEVPYDRAPPNLHQVQPVPLTQCTAWGLRSQEHTAHTHPGN